MTIDYFSGEVVREPVVIDKGLVGLPDPKPGELLDGESAFVSMGALWVHPVTRHLWINEDYVTWQACEVAGSNILDFARVIRYQGALIVDISHVGEVVRSAGDHSAEPFDFNANTQFRFPAIRPTEAAELEQHSVLVDGGFITDMLDLGMLRDHWNTHYSNSAPLVEIVFTDSSGEDLEG